MTTPIQAALDDIQQIAAELADDDQISALGVMDYLARSYLDAPTIEWCETHQGPASDGGTCDPYLPACSIKPARILIDTNPAAG